MPRHSRAARRDCCEFRKVEPLRRGSGRERGPGLADVAQAVGRPDPRPWPPFVSWDAAFGLVKVNPLATWTHDDVVSYLADRGLPEHPLVPHGIPFHRVRTDDPPSGDGRGPAGRPLVRARQDRVRPARLMPRDLDNPYGMEFRGRRDRGLQVRPSVPQHR